MHTQGACNRDGAKHSGQDVHVSVFPEGCLHIAVPGGPLRPTADDTQRRLRQNSACRKPWPRLVMGTLPQTARCVLRCDEKNVPICTPLPEAAALKTQFKLPC